VVDVEERDRRVFTIKERDRLALNISVLVDGLIFMNFSIFHVALRSANMVTLNVKIISWVIFIAALIAVNIWLYYVFYRKPKNQARSASL
jgi:hypothetical protein